VLVNELDSYSPIDWRSWSRLHRLANEGLVCKAIQDSGGSWYWKITVDGVWCIRLEKTMNYAVHI